MRTNYPQHARITHQQRAQGAFKCFQICAPITPEGLLKDNLKDKERIKRRLQVYAAKMLPGGVR